MQCWVGLSIFYQHRNPINESRSYCLQNHFRLHEETMSCCFRHQTIFSYNFTPAVVIDLTPKWLFSLPKHETTCLNSASDGLHPDGVGGGDKPEARSTANNRSIDDPSSRRNWGPAGATESAPWRWGRSFSLKLLQSFTSWNQNEILKKCKKIDTMWHCLLDENVYPSF